MTRILTTLFFIALISSSNLAIAQSDTEVETWYVWIDTEVEIESEVVRIVSETPIEITCCVKSPKYRKFIKKTAGWIRENVSDTYLGEDGTKKIQDLALAKKLINEAKASNNVKVIDYNASCK